MQVNSSYFFCAVFPCACRDDANIDVKDSSTLDALNKELSVELPVYEGCVADDTAGFKSATDKLNEQTDWYKAHTTSLQKAVDAVNASKK